MSLSWCGGSIQVTSDAWWDGSHGYPPPRQAPPPPEQATPRGSPPPRSRHPSSPRSRHPSCGDQYMSHSSSHLLGGWDACSWHPPPSRRLLLRAVRILLECISCYINRLNRSSHPETSTAQMLSGDWTIDIHTVITSILYLTKVFCKRNFVVEKISCHDIRYEIHSIWTELKSTMCKNEMKWKYYCQDVSSMAIQKSLFLSITFL